MQSVLASDALPVVGSSLMVWLAFRLMRAVAAGNKGRTRTDHPLDCKVERECVTALRPSPAN